MQLNAYVCHIYLSIDTNFCILVCLDDRYFMPQSIFFSIFSPILDFEKVTFLRFYATKWLFEPYLWTNWY